MMLPEDSSYRFDHLVVLMLENRSFDNLFGYLYENEAPKLFVPDEDRVFRGVAGRSDLYNVDVGREQGSQDTGGAQRAPQFGGKYADLTTRQKSLIDELYRRYSAVIGRDLDPAKSYDQEPLSWRTTFEAHTHALASSSLTDADEASLGAAIDLIDYIESIHGKIPGTRGDHQFRIYKFAWATVANAARYHLEVSA